MPSPSGRSCLHGPLHSFSTILNHHCLPCLVHVCRSGTTRNVMCLHTTSQWTITLFRYRTCAPKLQPICSTTRLPSLTGSRGPRLPGNRLGKMGHSEPDDYQPQISGHAHTIINNICIFKWHGFGDSGINAKTGGRVRVPCSTLVPSGYDMESCHSSRLCDSLSIRSTIALQALA